MSAHITDCVLCAVRLIMRPTDEPEAIAAFTIGTIRHFGGQKLCLEHEFMVTTAYQLGRECAVNASAKAEA